MHWSDISRGLSKNKLVVFSVVVLLLIGGVFIFSHPHKSDATSSIVITANAPQYNFQVLAGSTRQINAQISNNGVTPCVAGSGITCTVNWSVLSTTGGATATFTDPTHTGVSSISGALPTVQVNIGPTQGNCSITGTSGSYSVNSTASVIVQAQSVDDPTQTTTFLFNVCANSPTVLANSTSPVIVVPAYQQAYQTQAMTLQSWVVGCTDQTGHWSIVSQPSGGNGSLADTTNRDTVFTGSVTGRYTMQYTANCNGAVNTAIVYVSPNPMPSYVSTPNGTMPHECYPDPALTGADYEIGVGKQYGTLNSTPAINTWTPGTIMRVWNTDTTGSNPSVYHEYFQVSKSGTATQPIIICGVADAEGNLPIIDGSNATGQSGISPYAAGYGIMNVETPAAGGFWQQTPSQATTAQYISFTGLHIRNGNPNYSYYPPGSATLTPYGAESCVRFEGQYIDISGNDIDNCEFGLFSDDNNANSWWNASQNASVIGNHFHNNGWAGSGYVHQLYFQTYFALLQGNLINNMYPTGTGADVKWRGTAGIFRYNYFDGATSSLSGPAIQLDLTDNQDGCAYVSFECYLQGGDQQWPAGDTAGANMIAAYQQAQQQDYVYGNIFVSDPDQAVHYNGDEPSGMADRNGTLYFYNNTLAGASQVFRTNNNAEDDSFLQQRVNATNNIIWPFSSNVVGENSAMELATTPQIILNATTNLFETGSISITTPITGAPYTGPSGPVGWYAGNCGTAVCPWPLTIPFDTHIYNLTSANYLTTPTQPFNSTSYAPPSGSAAINAGSALTGVLTTMPVRSEYSVAESALVPRTNPLTIGAEDPGSGGSTPPGDTTPPTTSITSPLNNATVSGTVTISATASDNVGVTSVAFYVDGVLEGNDTTSPYSYSLNTANLSNSTHTLTTKASDAAGNVGTSATVTITVSNTATPPPDTTPPSVPTGLTVASVTSSSISLSWTASTDNVGVTGYDIYRGGVKIGTSNSTSYVNTGLTASTVYSYTVSAYDAAGNTSSQSGSVSGTTVSGGGTITQNGVTVLAITNTGVGSWSVPAGVTSIQIQLWGGGGGGSTYLLPVGGGAGAYVNETNVPVTAGENIAYTIASGGQGNQDGTPGVGGAGYKAGGSGTGAYGGGGGGSSAVTVGATTYIASGGGGGGSGGSAYGGPATGSSGGYGGDVSGGGGGSGTAGASANGTGQASGGTGGTAQTGTNGYDISGYGGGGSSAGASGNGNNAPSSGNGAVGSGAASGGAIGGNGAAGFAGTGSDSGGGGGLGTAYAGLGGNGGQPGGGGGGQDNYSSSAGNGGNGELVISYTASSGSGSTPDTTPPTTSITSPANNATISGTVVISATASDNVGVTSVGFYVDGVLKVTDTASPYTYSLNTASLSNGSHTLATKAYDAAGNIGTSENVTITVSNTVVATTTPPVATTTPPSGGGGGSPTPPPPAVITSVTASNITTTGAEITITTAATASVVVKYGPTTLYGNTTQASPYLTTNYVPLTGLTPNTIYDFVVIVTPTDSTAITSQGYTLQTLAPAGGTTPTPSSTSAFTKNIAFGDTGPQVTLLQQILYAQGFLPSKTYITGYFGSQTEHALLLFQSAHDLNRSGFVDTQTEALLNKIVAAGGAGTTTTTTAATPAVTTTTTATPATTTTSVGTLTENLAPGDSGSQVVILQTMLNQLGLLPADDETGYYGSLTEAAVKVFQVKEGIVSSGSPTTTGYGAVGPKTRAALNALE